MLEQVSVKNMAVQGQGQQLGLELQLHPSGAQGNHAACGGSCSVSVDPDA